MGQEDQSYRIYTAKMEADKALNSLKGILQGINIDKKVNTAELQELDKWCEKHQNLIRKEPFKDFMHTIRMAIRGDENPEEAVQDMFWLCQKYEDDNVYFDALTADLQTLQGVCHGILADGEINTKEIKQLEIWLDNNQHLSNYYPYDELRTVLLKILKDGLVDDEEQILLKAYFKEFVKLNNTDLTKKINEETESVLVKGLCAYDPDINFDGTHFTLSGNFKRGTKKEVSNRIESLGGKIEKNVVLKTNYLIIGADANDCWAFACYGRKVEKALNLRKKGQELTIINELDFWDIADDLN
ncbi:BRCT domain-containing protein [Leeuwenhoekiella marinoflava]|uniref:BRCA1 C Terminus (BRCT) protein n=2 Tax=Leeuwenhoekiella marinoflava TaxID=988 RepID=A0A4Q0PNB3_9FLAO|nr:BRCT domain-containing protein [Leeuwenhoekiella marinoflava]RXG32010.1 BRCA1 C Terminus (BRCT) protein [Leeuwenhoekiella marinoflava]SHE94876.1 BRCA1 C Terminus (BRCT) domain-containing protein [Leeuwenhoekiella marinoflava DSM 3653]